MFAEKLAAHDVEAGIARHLANLLRQRFDLLMDCAVPG
jgi:hypothetical protein